MKRTTLSGNASRDQDDIINQAKQRLLKRKRLQNTTPASSSTSSVLTGSANPSGKGLDVELHPLLRKVVQPTVSPVSHNPLKQKVRKWFDPASINPYLNQQDTTIGGRKSKPLTFNTSGKYIAEGERLREKLRQQKVEQELFEQKRARGLTADEDLGEQSYKTEYPPAVEWWDRPYLSVKSYDEVSESTLVLDDEAAPVSIYIQHPVLLPPLWDTEAEDTKVYLTKKEMKRKRRNERQQKLKIKQDRIKLGLDPPPPPKVKLSNLMNVLTNEAIKDPTAVEKQVRQEVEDRLKRHLDANEARKLTPEQRHDKIHTKNIKQLLKGLYTAVFKVDKLQNPQHLYKIDINAKQLELVGICLTNGKFNLVIVEGSHKNIQFYKKLLLSRIKWKENVMPKNAPADYKIEDNSDNKCQLVWEGEIAEFNFKKWSIMKTRNEDDVFSILNEFRIENYWRQAQVAE
jgi:U4/U6 small nuclear ribonucleoprotein PRP3